MDSQADFLELFGSVNDEVGEAVILRRFRDLCGGDNARIAVLGNATTTPDEVGDDYTKTFRAIGVAEVVTKNMSTRLS